jgi:FeS assembly SUF system protein
LKRDIIAALRGVHDPEIPVNIHDLGLIYKLDVDERGRVEVEMTLTTPNCPVAELIPVQVKKAIEGVPGVTSAHVALTWTPPWTAERMTDDARMTLDMMGISWKDPHGSVTKRPTPVTVRKTSR